MYYREFFSGSIESSVSKSISIRGASVTDFYNQSTVVRNAIIKVLKTVGFSRAVYDTTDNIIKYDSNEKFGFGLYFSSATQMGAKIVNYENTSQTQTVTSSGTQYQPFNGLNYQFYVTFFGDPSGMAGIMIGTNTTPASYTNFNIYRVCGKDLATGRDVAGIFTAATQTAPPTGFYFRTPDDGKMIQGEVYNALHSFTISINGQAGYAFFIPKFDNTGRIVLNNVYFGQSSGLAVGMTNYYTIDGEEYWAPHANYLVKS